MSVTIQTFDSYKKFQQEYYEKIISERKSPRPWDFRNLEQAKDPHNVYNFSLHFMLIMYKVSNCHQSWHSPACMRISMSMGVTYGDAKRLLNEISEIKREDLCIFSLEEKFLNEIGFDYSNGIKL